MMVCSVCGKPHADENGQLRKFFKVWTGPLGKATYVLVCKQCYYQQEGFDQ